MRERRPERDQRRTRRQGVPQRAVAASFDDNTNSADDCGGARFPSISVQPAMMTVCWGP
jgi:hypothetical protein